MLSCSVVSVLSSLLGLVGIAGLGHHYYHHSPFGIFGEEVKDSNHDHHRHGHSMEDMEAMKQKCDEGFKIIKCHRMCGDDMDCQDSCPLPSCPKMAAEVKGIIQCNQLCFSDDRCREVCNRPVKLFIDRCSRFAQGDVPHGFHERVEDFEPPPAQFIVSEFRFCHAHCGDDVHCKEQCPKPFWMKFKRTCDEAIPIMECHQACGHDHECHQKCPLPSCLHMKAHVEETMKCHGQCGDRECHHMCPKPMKKILMKCKAFMECQSCHEKCHDSSCHHECPKARLWKFFGKHGFGYHDDFRHHHDGKFHHHHDSHFHHHHDGDFRHHHDGDFHHHGAQPMIDPIAPVAPAAPALPPTLITKKTITCSMKCGWNAGCWDKCQEDWRELREHCEEMTQPRDGAAAAMFICHKKCHDHMCHQNCPRPNMPWLKEKVEASLGCHHECGDDRQCHHKCKCPFLEMKEECGMLGPQLSQVGMWEKEPEADAIML